MAFWSLGVLKAKLEVPSPAAKTLVGAIAPSTSGRSAKGPVTRPDGTLETV